MKSPFLMHFLDEDKKPIDFESDSEKKILDKIENRVSSTDSLFSTKKQQYDKWEAYFDGKPQNVSNDNPESQQNKLFHIIRNMSGLLTDSKPKPSSKVSNIDQDTPHDQVQKYLQTSQSLSRSLEEWWDENQMTSKFQRITMSLFVYADFFVMPYFSKRHDDVCIRPIHPKDVRIDPNCYDINKDCSWARVTLYKSSDWLYEEFDQEKAEKVDLLDQDEIQQTNNDLAGGLGDDYSKFKNVAKVHLYMTPKYFVYYSDDTVLKKFKNPYWAGSEDGQKKELKDKIKEKYTEGGKIKEAARKAKDKVKDAFGKETTEEKIQSEYDKALESFTPQKNYFDKAKIPLIRFDTYRLACEQYSRSVMEYSIPAVDNINRRKNAIDRNSENLAEPAVVVHGGHVDEEQAKNLNFKSDEATRIEANSSMNIGQMFDVVQGTPLPSQFFEDIAHDEQYLENLWGHHEASRGASDPNNQTKGGILALQEADQTPIRFLTRNIEDGVQELMNWVVHIRKLYEKKIGVGEAKDKEFVDYTEIDDHFQIEIKSGSMMPISREQQRADAIEMYKMGAIDPLTFHERMNDPNPEQTAKRLAAWKREGRILDSESEKEQKEVMKKINLIKQDAFEEVKVKETDNPVIHHDMLLQALKDEVFQTKEQEEFVADLVERYKDMAQKRKGEGEKLNATE